MNFNDRDVVDELLGKIAELEERVDMLKEDNALLRDAITQLKEERERWGLV